MGKTIRTIGYGDRRGEPKGIEDPRGNPERYSPGDGDDDLAYELEHPWTDEEFIANARLCVDAMAEVERIRALARTPVEEWPEADLLRVAKFLRGKWWEA